MAVKKGGLGRGLDSLFNENATDQRSTVKLRINEIEPNKNQPRRNFDDEALNELSSSIQLHGLLQPIIVRPLLSGRYEIIAGERRWRACRLAGLDEIPVIIKDLDEQSVDEIAMIENLQREDLNPVEQAVGIRSLMEKYSLTQEAVSERVGKSRSAVANSLRLLSLPEHMLLALQNGEITAGHARAILSVSLDEHREILFKMALNGANVREMEAAAKALLKGGSTAKKPVSSPKPTFYSEVELSLKNELGRRVSVKAGKGEKGTLTLEFYSKKELQDFANKLAGKK